MGLHAGFDSLCENAVIQSIKHNRSDMSLEGKALCPDVKLLDHKHDPFDFRVTPARTECARKTFLP